MKIQAFNPYLPSYEYIPDGEPYVFGDRVYIYGSHDQFDGKEFCVNNYVGWSAPVDDLGNWRYEGIIYDKTKDPMCESFEDHMLFAPDVQQGPDGRYYLYYVFDFTGVVSVAVCDSPAGEFEYYGSVRHPDGTLLGAKPGEPYQFDPGVLVDDDGRVYLYTGFCPVNFPWEAFGSEKKIVEGPMVTELEDDMITVKVGPRIIGPYGANSEGTGYEGHEFFEASSMRKINGKYYFIYSSLKGHELCYAVSHRPDGDFSYGGTIISNGDIYLNGRKPEEAVNYTGNNHGSIVEIGGQWYVFYHRQTNGHQFSRQGCAEKIRIEEDGSIKQVEMTSCGLNDGPLMAEIDYEARIACVLKGDDGAFFYDMGQVFKEDHPHFTQDGIDRDDQPDQHIANMTHGSVVGFKYFVHSGEDRIQVKVRGNGEGYLEVAKVENDQVLGKVSVGASEEWTSFTGDMLFGEGESALYFTYQGEGAIDFMSFKTYKA